MLVIIPKAVRVVIELIATVATTSEMSDSSTLTPKRLISRTAGIVTAGAGHASNKPESDFMRKVKSNKLIAAGMVTFGDG